MLQVIVKISQRFIVEKRHGAMQKFEKKKKKREREKMSTKMFEVFKTMGT
jgi:hypothetical protein